MRQTCGGTHDVGQLVTAHGKFNLGFFRLIILGSTGLGRDVMAAAQPPQKKAKSSQAESCELAMPKGTLDQLAEALTHALQRNMAGEVPAPAPVNKGSLPLPQPKGRPVQVGYYPSTNPNVDPFKYQDVSAENRPRPTNIVQRTAAMHKCHSCLLFAPGSPPMAAALPHLTSARSVCPHLTAGHPRFSRNPRNVGLPALKSQLNQTVPSHGTCPADAHGAAAVPLTGAGT